MRTQTRRKSVDEKYGGKSTGGSLKEESCNTRNCPSKITLLFFFKYLPNATLINYSVQKIGDVTIKYYCTIYQSCVLSLQLIANGIGGSLGHHAPNHVEEECAHKIEENP